MTSSIQAAEAMREAAAKVAERLFNYSHARHAREAGGQIAEAIRAIPLPTEAASEPFTSEPFKATRIDMDSSGVTVWALEDCATVARDAFPGVHHFIDELRAMEDGRLVGVQFWGPPPVRAAEPGEAVTMEGSRGMTDEQIIEGMLIAANDACDDDDEDHAGAMAAALAAAKPLIYEQALREAVAAVEQCHFRASRSAVSAAILALIPEPPHA